MNCSSFIFIQRKHAHNFTISNWFFKHFVPSVSKCQNEVLERSPNNAKTILISNNTSPNAQKMAS
jgi:hypothetical protein